MDENLSAEQLANMSTSELVKVSNRITGRLNNTDWQKLVHDLRASGHIHTFREHAPLLLQRFLRLEIDLDHELAKQAAGAPLMTNISLTPRRPRGDEQRVVALLSGQDSWATVQMEVFPHDDMTSFLFSINNMLSLRFHLPKLDVDERRQYLDMMHRDSGITVLWTRERWEQDYLIFIKQDFFTRVYAYSSLFEATTRMTNEVTGTLIDWLERGWFPRTRERRRITKNQTQLMNVFSPITKAVEGVSQLSDQIVKPKPKAKDELSQSDSGISDENLVQLRDQLADVVDSGRTILKRAAGSEGDVLKQIFDHIDQRAKKRDATELVEVEEQLDELMKTHPRLVSNIREQLKVLLEQHQHTGEENPPEEPGAKDSNEFIW